MRRRAFTLVELLVVIGIIAILIGILLPTLARARESSNRTVCLSNMRELANCFRIYAANYKDYCPIGFMDQKAFSYFVFWGHGSSANPRWLSMGLLWESQILKNPKAFFCPSEPESAFRYLPNPDDGTFSANPWPPSPLAKTHTKLGYNCRPIVNWPADNYSGKVTWPGAPPFSLKEKLAWLPGDGRGNIALPRLANLKNQAIVADLVIDQTYVLRRHKKGINVLYANGSGKWVGLDQINVGRWPQLRADGSKGQGFDSFYADAQNQAAFLDDGTWQPFYTAGSRYEPKGGVWYQMDKAP
jgi:prepilin-type N-terminal cleavage/methylation domain-containing protein